MLALLVQQGGRLDSLLHATSAEPAALAAALAVAFFFGAAHALTPGHGKALVAAYLAGSRGGVRDAVMLGITVTVTHTLAVFILGLAALYAARHVNLELISRQLSFASALLVTAIGVWLLQRRLRADRSAGNRAHSHGHEHPHPDHSHDHGHGHHHHHVPDKPGLAGLLGLGISGGLVPCPEALVLLMLSISLQRVAFGLALLALFSLGLAGVLIAIGCAMVYAGPAVLKLSKTDAIARRLPVASAAVVSCIGAVMLFQSLRNL